MTNMLHTFANIDMPVADDTSTAALRSILDTSLHVEHELGTYDRRTVQFADGFYAVIRWMSEHQVEQDQFSTGVWEATLAAVDVAEEFEEPSWEYFSIEVFAAKLEQYEDGSFSHVTVEVTSVEDLNGHLAANFSIRYFGEEVNTLEWLDADYDVVSADRNNDAWPELFEKVATFFDEPTDSETFIAFEKWVYSEVSEQAKAFGPVEQAA